MFNWIITLFLEAIAYLVVTFSLCHIQSPFFKTLIFSQSQEHQQYSWHQTPSTPTTSQAPKPTTPIPTRPKPKPTTTIPETTILVTPTPAKSTTPPTTPNPATKLRPETTQTTTPPSSSITKPPPQQQSVLLQ